MKEKLKESDLRAMADCGLCRRPFGHTGAPIFYRVAIASYGVNAPAIQRQTGLTARCDSLRGGDRQSPRGAS